MHISNCPYLRLTRSIYASSNKSSILSVPCLSALQRSMMFDGLKWFLVGVLGSFQVFRPYILLTSATAKVLYLLSLLLLLSLLNSIHWGKPQKYIWTSTYMLAGWLAGCCIKPSAPLFFFSHFDLCETNAQGWTDGRTDWQTSDPWMYVCIYSNTFTKCDSFNVVASSRISLSHK